MTKLTRYEQGFLTKCAEYGVPKQVAGAMLKRAAPWSALGSAAKQAFRGLYSRLFRNSFNHVPTAQGTWRPGSLVTGGAANPWADFMSEYGLATDAFRAAVDKAAKGQGTAVEKPLIDAASKAYDTAQTINRNRGAFFYTSPLAGQKGTEAQYMTPAIMYAAEGAVSPATKKVLEALSKLK